MKTFILYTLLLIISVNSFAEDVSVTTPDGSVIIYKGDLLTTSQLAAFYALYDGINQCRLYIKLAEGITSQGLNELQTSVDVLPGEDIVFPSISLPPSTDNEHNLVLQCLGPVQDGKRQVTFSTEIVLFDIFPNVTTNLDLEIYLTKLTVRAIVDSNYVVRGEDYQVETVANKVIPITLDADETAFTLTYEIGDQPKLISDSSGEKLGNIAYDPTFGNVFTENLSLNVNDGRMSISTAFIVGEVILSSPGVLIDNMPDRSDSMIYDFGVRGLEVGDYNVVLTVDGAEVEYSLDVTIDSGVPVSSTTGRIDAYSISSLGQTMNLNINLATMYDDIDAGTYTDPVVRLFLVKGGEL
jgi:hypothetical protein